MDNASRALTMAGSVLIAIAVISLVVYTFTNAQSFAEVNEMAMSTSQIESFNRFYTSYRTTYSGASTIKCIDAVNILNRAVADGIESDLITENSAHISKSGDYYFADSAKYVTRNLKYELGFDADGKVSEIKISD